MGLLFGGGLSSSTTYEAMMRQQRELSRLQGFGLGQSLLGGMISPDLSSFATPNGLMLDGRKVAGRLLIADSDTGLEVLQKETDRWLRGVLGL